MKKLIYITAFVFFVTTQVNAQDITSTPLNWNTSSVVDNENNTSLSYQCTIKSNGDQSIDWVQGSSTYHYTIIQTVGAWSSVASDGELIYKVSAGTNVTGSFTFSRSGDVIHVLVKTSTDGEPDLDLLFTISSVQPIQ